MLGQYAPAHSVASFKDRDRVAPFVQIPCSDETGEASADHDDLDVWIWNGGHQTPTLCSMC